VVGVIESFTGRFWSHGQAGRLTSDTYRALRTRVLAPVAPPIMRVQDGAKSHPSVARQRCLALSSERWLVFQLPSDSPAENPLAKRWKNVKKAGPHVPSFPTFEALTNKVAPALLKFAKTPEAMRSLCSLPTAWAQAA
jgi:hypothetical protein